MNPFIIPEIVETTERLAGRHFPFAREKELQRGLGKIFSMYLGNLKGGHRRDANGLLVTGQSGSGKSQEINHMLDKFHDSGSLLPSGTPARFVRCKLDGTIGWKDLGRKTLQALGYPISDSSRITQSRIWEKVVLQAKAQEVVGIYFDEAQHIFRGKSETEHDAILDSFKALMKPEIWPLMMIFSGVPELLGYIQREVQLFRLLNKFHLADIVAPDDYLTIHQIVGSYAIESGMQVSLDISGPDFFNRLATAAAFRWGILIELTLSAISFAAIKGAATLERDHFVDAWVDKTEMQPFVSPFTHEGYQTLYRRDRPFQVSVPA